MKATAYLNRAEIRTLRQKSDLRGAWLVLHAWLVVAATMAAYALVPHPLVLAVGLFVVAGRQLGLAILMHDASHGLLFRTRALNDFAGQWLTGTPVGADLSAYRPYHMKHHRFTQQAEDPDLGLAAPFPISRASLARKFLRDLTGWTFLRTKLFLLRVSLEPGRPWHQRLLRLWRTLGSSIFANLVLAGGFVLAGRLDLYLLLWLLPLATTHQLVIRIRSIAEHAIVPDNDDRLRNTRTTRASWLERAFLAPYWVNYHIEHHLFVWMPCFQLARAHRVLTKKGLGAEMEIRDGYLEILRLATSGAAPGAKPATA